MEHMTLYSLMLTRTTTSTTISVWSILWKLEEWSATTTLCGMVLSWLLLMHQWGSTFVTTETLFLSLTRLLLLTLGLRSVCSLSVMESLSAVGSVDLDLTPPYSWVCPQWITFHLLLPFKRIFTNPLKWTLMYLLSNIFSPLSLFCFLLNKEIMYFSFWLFCFVFLHYTPSKENICIAANISWQN